MFFTNLQVNGVKSIWGVLPMERPYSRSCELPASLPIVLKGATLVAGGYLP
jgi:hypothetical protein